MISYVKYQAELLLIADFYQKIATVAHNCYQVVGKTTDQIFVQRLITNRHLAMCEHHLFHFVVGGKAASLFGGQLSPYITVSTLDHQHRLVTCSIRPLLEATGALRAAFIPLFTALPADVKELLSPFEELEGAKLVEDLSALGLGHEELDRHQFATVKIITDRGVSHELVRHRPCSYAQESTRYCNYSKEKFHHSIAIMRPLEYERYMDIYDRCYQQAEDGYFSMLEAGATPDIARALLPNGLKTSIIVTASIAEYRHIMELRLDPAAHPDMQLTMSLVKQELQKGGYIDE